MTDQTSASPGSASTGLREDDVFTLMGHAEFLRRVRGEADMPAYFFDLAERIARTIGDDELARRVSEVARAGDRMSDSLARLRAIAEGATPGPWRTLPHGAGADVRADADSGSAWVAMCRTEKDADFIAAARNAFPALLTVAQAAQELQAHLDRIGMTREEEPLMDSLRSALDALEGME